MAPLSWYLKYHIFTATYVKGGELGEIEPPKKWLYVEGYKKVIKCGGIPSNVESLSCDKLINVQYPFFEALRGMEDFQKMGVEREKNRGH